MLRNLDELKDFPIRATDGDIGQVKDFFFDDQSWTIRYLVVETGDWLASRKVLISPIAIAAPDQSQERITVSISKQQVRDSPDIDTHQPVSRQNEIEYLSYYQYPLYWMGPGPWGLSDGPSLLMPEFVSTPSVIEPQADTVDPDNMPAHPSSDDPHLRSVNAMAGYHIHASDGDIGHVQGLLIDEATWAIRYLIVNTSNWWLGHQVLIAPSWIEQISWIDSTVSLVQTRQSIQDAPPYNPDVIVDGVQDIHILAHYEKTARRGSADSEQIP